MQLLTDADRALLEKYPLYSQDNKKAEAVVILKYFLPGTAATWYVLEGSPEEYEAEGGGTYEDITFFGYVEGIVEGGEEYGYFTLKQLEEIEVKVPVIIDGKESGALPCKVEKDLYLREGITIGELVPAVRELWKDSAEG